VTNDDVTISGRRGLTAMQAPRRPGTTPVHRLGTTIWLDDNATGLGRRDLQQDPALALGFATGAGSGGVGRGG